MNAAEPKPKASSRKQPEPDAAANTVVIRTWKSDGLRRPVPIWHAAGVISAKGHLSRLQAFQQLLDGERLETNVSYYELPQ